MAIKLTTPKGQLFKQGEVEMMLKWNPTTIAQLELNLNKAQVFIDNEVLSRSEAYIPRDTGDLIQSGDTGTTRGSGTVTYHSPYATLQYYSMQSRPYDARRGGRWFERMKADHKSSLLRMVSEIAWRGL